MLRTVDLGSPDPCAIRLKPGEIARLLDQKRHYCPKVDEAWHDEAFALLQARYEKSGARILGDK